MTTDLPKSGVTPLFDCRMEAGGLMVIAGKHKLNYTMDVRISLGRLCKLCAESQHRTMRSQLKDKNGCPHKHRRKFSFRRSYISSIHEEQDYCQTIKAAEIANVTKNTHCILNLNVTDT